MNNKKIVQCTQQEKQLTIGKYSLSYNFECENDIETSIEIEVIEAKNKVHFVDKTILSDEDENRIITFTYPNGFDVSNIDSISLIDADNYSNRKKFKITPGNGNTVTIECPPKKQYGKYYILTNFMGNDSKSAIVTDNITFYDKT